MTTVALAAALALAENGLACFPCSWRKSPAIPGPGGYKHASTDCAALERLWHDHPGPLVGVATGAISGIDVLDLDADHREARCWWAEHRDGLLPTRVHRTRDHGLHLVYAHREDLRCTQSAIAPGVDTRADGGYVIWWPASGFPILSSDPIANWPEWFALPAQSTPPPMLATSAVAPRTTAIGYGATALERAYTRIVMAGCGDQERTLSWEALCIGSLVAGGELPLERARAALHDAARRMPSYYPRDPWRPGQPERKIDRALARGLAVPRRRRG